MMWVVRFGDGIEIERSGEPFRPRIRQQTLLLARLVVDPNGGLDRAEAAELLWPETEKSDARTYLRRAIMELKSAGVEILTNDAGISIRSGTFESNFEDAAASGVLGSNGEKLAPDWHSPMLDSIRRLAAARRKRAGTIRPRSSAEEDADRFVVSLLGEALLSYDPVRAMALVAAHRYDFYTKAPEDDVLRFLNRLCRLVTDPSSDRVAVLCVAAGISTIQTQYGAADSLYSEAIRDAESLGESALLARALAMRTGLLIELRHWEEARTTSERAVQVGRECGKDPDYAFSLAARAAYQWHVGFYDDAVRSYEMAIELAEPGPHQDNPRQNLAFVWGVLGGHCENPPTRPESKEYQGGYLRSGQFYQMFSLGIGYGRYHEAALGAAGSLALAADAGMERIVAINLDNAAIAFAKLDHSAEAAACVRLGTRLRGLLEHDRSPMERDALRRHVTSGYFVSDARDWIQQWRAPDPAVTAHRIAARLRLLAGEHGQTVH